MTNRTQIPCAFCSDTEWNLMCPGRPSRGPCGLFVMEAHRRSLSEAPTLPDAPERTRTPEDEMQLPKFPMGPYSMSYDTPRQEKRTGKV